MPKSLTEKDWSILLGRIRDGRCTPFLGPEACYPVLPPGNQLAHEWAEKCGYPLDDAIDLARVAQFLGVDVDPVHPKEKLAEEFKDVAAPDFRTRTSLTACWPTCRSRCTSPRTTTTS